MKHTKSMVYKPSDEARELFLYAINTGDLYRRSVQPAIANLRRKAIKGTYDREKAADLFTTLPPLQAICTTVILDTALT